MLRQLKVLCQQYPQRFHIYGCNWTVTLNHLRGLAYSADSSLAWDGARYGLIIHIRNGKLMRTPAWKLGFEGNREARCIVCAKNIQRFMAQR
jgi:hypothetical protein